MGQGLLIHEPSRSHSTTHHSRYDSSGRVISPSQRPLSENTQHSQQTSVVPVGFEPTISAGERPQTYALDRTVTGTGQCSRSPFKIPQELPRLTSPFGLHMKTKSTHTLSSARKFTESLLLTASNFMTALSRSAGMLNAR